MTRTVLGIVLALGLLASACASSPPSVADEAYEIDYDPPDIEPPADVGPMPTSSARERSPAA